MLLILKELDNFLSIYGDAGHISGLVNLFFVLKIKYSLGIDLSNCIPS